MSQIQAGNLMLLKNCLAFDAFFSSEFPRPLTTNTDTLILTRAHAPYPMLEYIYVCRHGFRYVPFSLALVYPIHDINVYLSYTVYNAYLNRSNWIDESIKTSPTGMNRDPPVCFPTT